MPSYLPFTASPHLTPCCSFFIPSNVSWFQIFFTCPSCVAFSPPTDCLLLVVGVLFIYYLVGFFHFFSASCTYFHRVDSFHFSRSLERSSPEPFGNHIPSELAPWKDHEFLKWWDKPLSVSWGCTHAASIRSLMSNVMKKLRKWRGCHWRPGIAMALGGRGSSCMLLQRPQWPFCEVLHHFPSRFLRYHWVLPWRT